MCIVEVLSENLYGNWIFTIISPSMVVCGPRFEVPTILPNRTRTFVHDLKQFIAEVNSDYVALEFPVDIFTLTKTKFKETQFFRAIDPVNHSNSVESSFRKDTEELTLVSLVLSVRSTPSDAVIEIGILLSLLLLIVHYYDSTGESRETEIPVNVQDLEKFHEISTRFPEFRSLLTQLFPRFSPRMKCHQLYLDRRGVCSVRDNTADAIVRDLSKGEKTGRAIKVTMDPITRHVTLVNTRTNDALVDVEALLQSSFLGEETKHQIRETVSGLNDVIPAPTDEEFFTSEEERPSDDLLPTESMRRMLRSGRVPKRKERRIKLE